MIINLKDESLLGFLEEILENKSLLALFSDSRYWKRGGEQAVKLMCNSTFDVIPQEVTDSIEKLLTDVCPDRCDAGCEIGWDYMATALLNGDHLCEYHHHSKEKIENE